MQNANIEIKVNCPNCKSSVDVPLDKLRRGDNIFCPGCQFKFDSKPLLKVLHNIEDEIEYKMKKSGGGIQKIDIKSFVEIKKVSPGEAMSITKTYGEPDKLDTTQSGSNYYHELFMPAYNRFWLFGKINLALWIPALILIAIFAPNIFLRYEFWIIAVIDSLIGAYFAWGVRCPKCCRRVLLGWFGIGTFMMAGRCGSCGVQLKNRSVSITIERIIRISLISICIIALLVLLYYQLTQGTCIKITYH